MLSFEPGIGEDVGAWSPQGEFLGLAIPETSDASGGLQSDYLHVGRGDSEGSISMTLHRFTRAGEEGYRVQVREWNGAEESAYWVAPTTEDEGYIGMFTEDEARQAFPYLFAAREIPDGFEIG